MSERKPALVPTILPRGLCPVCHKPSYSLTGTHPQCAVARADAISRAARKADPSTVSKAASRKPWSKPCPQCKREIPARRVVCDCGHNFAPGPDGAKTAT